MNEKGIYKKIRFYVVLRREFFISRSHKFSNECVSCQKNFNSFDTSNYNTKVAIVAAYSNTGTIDKNLVEYLKELKLYHQFIILIYDNPIQIKELDKINNIVNVFIAKRHKLYDFGSYKIGLEWLEDNNYLNYISNITFCNDSVIYTNKNMYKYFKLAFKEAFYGLTYSKYGIKRDGRIGYAHTKCDHIQTYLFTVSRKFINEQEFLSLIKSVKKEKNKLDIVINYEEKLSSIANSLGYKLKSYLPIIETNINPSDYYLSTDYTNKKDQYFLKKKDPHLNLEDVNKVNKLLA